MLDEDEKREHRELVTYDILTYTSPDGSPICGAGGSKATPCDAAA